MFHLSGARCLSAAGERTEMGGRRWRQPRWSGGRRRGAAEMLVDANNVNQTGERKSVQKYNVWKISVWSDRWNVYGTSLRKLLIKDHNILQEFWKRYISLNMLKSRGRTRDYSEKFALYFEHGSLGGLNVETDQRILHLVTAHNDSRETIPRQEVGGHAEIRGMIWYAEGRLVWDQVTLPC